MSHYAVTAIGADRPGIVAAVTGVLMEHGCNLEDTSMTILRGHFAMMLVVAGPQTSSASDLEAALSEVHVSNAYSGKTFARWRVTRAWRRR